MPEVVNNSSNIHRMQHTHCKGSGFILSLKLLQCINTLVTTTATNLDNTYEIDIEADMMELTADIAVGKYASYCGVYGKNI